MLLLLVNTFSQHFCLFLIVAVKGLGWCAGFLWLWQVGATFCCGVQASHCGGFSCGAQAPGTWASVLATRRLQYLWHMSLVAPWHVESSWTRDQTHVPCIGRQILGLTTGPPGKSCLPLVITLSPSGQSRINCPTQESLDPICRVPFAM